MYKEMYNTFDDVHIPYSYPYSFEKNRLDYMESESPEYEFDYGDTIIFPFQISDEYINCDILIKVFNFRYEEVYEIWCKPDECGRVYLNITQELSLNTFKKGLYPIQIQAQCATDDGGYYTMTLISPSDKYFRVK